MARRNKKTSSSKSKSSGLLSKAKSLVTGKKGSGKKRRKPSVTALATELARIKLKRKIRAEKLKVM